MNLQNGRGEWRTIRSLALPAGKRPPRPCAQIWGCSHTASTKPNFGKPRNPCHLGTSPCWTGCWTACTCCWYSRLRRLSGMPAGGKKKKNKQRLDSRVVKSRPTKSEMLPREGRLSMGALRMSFERKGLVTFDEDERPSAQTMPGRRGGLQQPSEYEDLSQVKQLRVTAAHQTLDEREWSLHLKASPAPRRKSPRNAQKQKKHNYLLASHKSLQNRAPSLLFSDCSARLFTKNHKIASPQAELR